MSYDSKAGNVGADAKDNSTAGAMSDALGSFAVEAADEMQRIALANPHAQFEKIAKDTQEEVAKKNLPELALAAAATRGKDSGSADSSFEKTMDAAESGAGTNNLDIQDYNPEPTKTNA